jgi:hypothetical protein
MSYSSEVLADSPACYLRLADTGATATDATTNGNDGTFVGSGTKGVTGLLVGDSNLAFYANAAGYVSVPQDATLELGNGPMSFECLVQLDGAGIGGQHILFNQRDGSDLGIELRIKDTTGYLELWAPGLDFGVVSTVAIADTNVHHVVATKNGSTMYLYLDGSDVTGTPIGSADVSSVTSVTTYIASQEGGNTLDGTIDEAAVYDTVLSSTRVAAHYAAATASGPTWVSPADGAGIGTTPVLVFTSPVAGVAQHFNLQLDTVDTFDSGNLRDLATNTSQTGWEYWNDSAWTAFPAGGLASGYSGNDVRHTVQSALSATTWYRRVRAGS